ncbi:MAG: phosphate/phosphite/phosphonate ABC transporter substrate-binding protein [Hydrogenophilales bacterium]|nr:phosphate/phosphite/phosphonate ABC transporter substrate-binding protein [Hydrogenophilales bacterium]
MHLFSRLVLILLCCIAGFAHAEPGGQVLTLGITPQQSPTELAKLWGPICQYLGKRTGYQVQFKTSKDLNAFWKDTGDGAFDLVYINPPRYVNAHTTPGYIAFAKDSDSPLINIIVVRKDGPASVEELHGKKLAVPNLIALAALVPQAYLREKGVDVTLAAVNSHDSVYRTVEKGLYPAGASLLRIFGMLDPATQAQFRVLWKSDPLPPFAYAAHPRVPPKAIERIQRALLEMDGNPEGRTLLAALNVKAIVAAKDSDYDVMRKMKLKLE